MARVLTSRPITPDEVLKYDGKLPAIGIIGGFFDERRGIRKAAYSAADLLSSGSFGTRPV